MIEEVQVLRPGGIPIFYKNRDESKNDLSDTDLLQASFISAMGEFAQELEYGQLKTIELENRSYLVKKGPLFSVVFGCRNETAIDDYSGNLELAYSFLETKYEKEKMGDASDPQLDSVMNEFDQHLQENKILDGTPYTSKFISKIDDVLFKIVGYTPGVCNIGPEARYFRLTLGLVAIIASLLLLVIMIRLDLPRDFRWFLYITNSIGISLILQYYHRFCVKNAMMSTYSMR